MFLKVEAGCSCLIGCKLWFFFMTVVVFFLLRQVVVLLKVEANAGLIFFGYPLLLSNACYSALFHWHLCIHKCQ